MRIIFYTILVTLGLALSIIILVPSFFDLNTYKIKLYELVEKQTGYNLEIKGSIGISIFPRLKLNANNIALSNNKEILFKAEDLVVYPSFTSFLKGNLYFDSIKLENSLVVVKKNKEKLYNWSVVKPDKDKKEKKMHKDIETLDKKNKESFFIINNFYLKNSSLKYSDTNTEETIDDINLNFRQDNKKKYSLKGSFVNKGLKTNINFIGSNVNKEVSLEGDLSSKLYKLTGSGIYNYHLNNGKFNIAGNIKSKQFLSKIKNLKGDDLQINAELILNKNILLIEKLKLFFHDTLFHGSANLNFTKKKSDIIIKLSSDKLVLDKFFNISQALRDDQASFDKSNSKGISNKTEDVKKNINVFEVLEKINLDSVIKAKQVIYKDIHVDNIVVKLNKKKNMNVFLEGQNFFKASIKSKLSLTKKMNFFLDANLSNLSLIDLNKYYDVNLISGNINLSTNLKGKFEKGEKIYKSIYGNSLISSKEIIIKNFNLKALKTDIIKLDNLTKINEARKALFNGNTNIKDQKIKFVHDKETIKIPITRIKIDPGFITTSGNYNIDENNLNLISKYESDQNKLLSLFSLKTTGQISKPLTQISFDEGAVTSILEKVAEKKLKKVIEEKLEEKFDNILDKLLE